MGRGAHANREEKGLPRHHIHITRMTPKRVDELAGGSLYWVIRGEIAAREKIIAIEPFRDRDGIGRCRLVMQPKVIGVLPRPMRAFQGWRYSPIATFRRIWDPPAPASRRCPNHYAANCANSIALASPSCFGPRTRLHIVDQAVLPIRAATRIRIGPSFTELTGASVSA